MDLTARQAEISDLLRQEEFITVESLADKFNVTTQTVRRDINALCDYGQARRRHGGVELDKYLIELPRDQSQKRLPIKFLTEALYH